MDSDRKTWCGVSLVIVSSRAAVFVVRLTEKLARCKASRGKGKARTSARRRKRRLWGDGSGAFRTSGRRSAATVSGTRWLVEDSCAGTLTKVARGKVKVRDYKRRKTVTVRAGHSYRAL